MKRSTAILSASLLVAYVVLIVAGSLRERPVSIDELIDPETRLRTYHRLWVKTEPAQKHDFYKHLHRYSNFQGDHRSILIQKIPVPGDPDHPLYLTWRDTNLGTSHLKPPWSSWGRVIEWSSWKSWFFPPDRPVAAPPLAEPTLDPVMTRYVISLHSHDGTLLDEEQPRPFGGNNVSEPGEIFYDINGDGWVERVSSMSIGFLDSDTTAELLTITRIDRETEGIFHAVINVGKSESAQRWGFACRDVDGDGTWEVEIGPKRGTGISPEVTFFWNGASGTYESPSGRAGPHFLVVPPEDLWDILKKLRDEGRLSYPLDR